MYSQVYAETKLKDDFQRGIKCDSCSNVIEFDTKCIVIICMVEINIYGLPSIGFDYGWLHTGCWRERANVLRKHRVDIEQVDFDAVNEVKEKEEYKVRIHLRSIELKMGGRMFRG